MAKDDHIMIEEAFAQKRMSKALLSRLISYIRPYKRTFFLNLLFTLLATISQLLGPKFIQIGIDRYLAGGATLAGYHQHITCFCVEGKSAVLVSGNTRTGAPDYDSRKRDGIPVFVCHLAANRSVLAIR